MSTLIIRQGDVLFTKVNSIPKGGKKRDNGIVAYGEATGHAHRLSILESAEVLECGDGLYVHVSASGISLEGATFVHQEHGPAVLPPGKYRVDIQKEYAPSAIRNVID
jgi:hypothetical protein